MGSQLFKDLQLSRLMALETIGRTHSFAYLQSSWGAETKCVGCLSIHGLFHDLVIQKELQDM